MHYRSRTIPTIWEISTIRCPYQTIIQSSQFPSKCWTNTYTYTCSTFTQPYIQSHLPSHNQTQLHRIILGQDCSIHNCQALLAIWPSKFYKPANSLLMKMCIYEILLCILYMRLFHLESSLFVEFHTLRQMVLLATVLAQCDEQLLSFLV